MLLGYGGLTYSFGITSSPGSSAGLAAFLNSSSAMADGRSTTATSISFDPGSPAITQYVNILVTVTSTLDATVPWGVVGLINVQGLPEGTKCTFGGVTQRLTRDANGDLSAWWLPPPTVTGATHGIFIYNDVNGSASITPGETFAVGEIFVGRVMYLRDIAMSGLQNGLIDSNMTTILPAGTVHEVMRLPRNSPIAVKLGLFTTAQAKGNTTSDLVSGANPAGVIDIRTLRLFLATTRVCAICDTPSQGKGSGTTTNGHVYDQDFMQANWQLARPLDIGNLSQDQYPYWTWSPSWQAAT